MISLFGLVLNTLGAFVILVPDIPKLYRACHKLPPLETIEAGEKQLYQDGELLPEHPGFDHIAEAFFSESPPLSDAPRLDDADTNSAMVRIGDTEIESDRGGYEVKRVFRNDGDTIFDSTYTVELYSQPMLRVNERLAEAGIPTPNPYLSMESSHGAFPEYISRYKRRLFFRLGAFLLLIGFAMQVLDRIIV